MGFAVLVICLYPLFARLWPCSRVGVQAVLEHHEGQSGLGTLSFCLASRLGHLRPLDPPEALARRLLFTAWNDLYHSGLCALLGWAANGHALCRIFCFPGAGRRLDLVSAGLADASLFCLPSGVPRLCLATALFGEFHRLPAPHAHVARSGFFA